MIAEQHLGPLCALLSSCTWAIGSSNYAKLSRAHSPFAVNFMRALIALPLFALAVFVTSGGWSGGIAAFGELRPSHWAWFGLSMFASYAIGDVLFMWSTRSLGVPGALAVASTFPLLTALVDVFVEGNALGPARIAGLVIAVAGIVTVILSSPKQVREASVVVAVAPTVGPRDRRERWLGIRWVGVSLALTTAVLWAINSYAVARGGRDLPSSLANCIRMLWALGLGAAMSRLIQPPGQREIVLPLRVTRAYLWLFAIEAFGGSYFFTYGLSHSPLVLGSVLTSLAPILAVPVAWALGLEKLRLSRTIGVAAVVLGLWLLITPG